MNILVTYLHHLAAFTLVSTLVGEMILIHQPLSLPTAKTLRFIDGMYGASAMIIIVMGVLRVMYFEKGLDYYLHNPAFMMKMTVFIIVGLLSIYPTVVFMRWGKTLKQNSLPELSSSQTRMIQRILKLELAGVTLIILGAVLMAKGFHL